MALTAAESKELYQFFAVAFNAAPGVEYMNQLYDARNSGMTMEQVVEVFTTKTQFTNIYPNFLTDETFATRLVDNVVGDAATAAAKAEAVADIVAALALGWSRGKTIYTIFGNLAAKAETDETWGTTAKQFNNQVAVAQYYTETLLVNTTDVTKLQAVIANVTATTDVSSASAIENVIYSSGGTTDVASELTTTAGETVTGTPGNDVFEGTAGLDLQDGDKILGGSGSDTLELRASTGVAGLVTLESVDTVSLNLRAASASFDALLWSGTTLVEVNADSVAGRTGTFTNASLDTTFAANKSGTDITVTFEDTASTSDSASIAVGSVGAQGATFVLNGTGGDIETLNVAVSGVAGVTLRMSAAADNVTVTGAASGTLTIDFQNTSPSGTLDLSGFDGDTSVTVSAASNLTFAGSDGDDSLTIGALASGDSLDGGAGEDTLRLGGAIGASGEVAGFETLTTTTTYTAAAGLSLSGATFSTINVGGSSTGSLSLVDLADGTTVNILSRDQSAPVISFDGGAGTINSKWSGTETYASMRVSGAASIDIGVPTTVSSVTHTATRLDVQGIEDVTLFATGSGIFTVTQLNASGVTTLSLEATTAATLNVDELNARVNNTTVDLTIETLSLTANGKSATVDMGDTNVVSFDGLTTLNVDALNGGTVSFAANESITAVSGSTLAVTVDVTGDGSVGVAGAGLGVAITNAGTLTYTVNSTSSGQVVASAIDAGAAGTLAALSITMGEEGAFTGANVAAKNISEVTLVGSQSGSFSLGTLDASHAVGAVSITAGASGSMSVGEISAAASGIGAVTLIVGASGDLTVTKISSTEELGAVTIDVAAQGDLTITNGIAGGSGSFGAITATLGASASANLGIIVSTTNATAGAIGDIVITGTQDSTATIGSALTDDGIGSITISVGACGDISVGDLTSTSAGIADITLTAGSGSTIALGSASTQASMGDLAITSSGTVTVEDMDIGGSVGTISIRGDSLSSLSSIVASGMGDLTLNIDAATTIAIDSSGVGVVTIAGGSATLTIDAHSSTVDSIVFAGGSGSVTVSDATGIADGVYTTGNGAKEAIIDVAGVSSAVDFELGYGVNTVTLTRYNDQITLTAATGADTLVLNENNGASGVTVFNFQFSGMARTQTADAIALSSNLDIGLMSAGVAPVMSATTNELMVELFTAASQVITLGSAAADEGVGVIALMTSLAEDGYYATISEVLAAMGSGGAGGLSLASAIGGTVQLATAGNVLVLFSDGADSYLYQVGLTATVNATFTATNTDVTLLATFDTTDITTFSGTNFDGIFEID